MLRFQSFRLRPRTSPPRRKGRPAAGLRAALLAAMVIPSAALADQPAKLDYTELSLEALTNLEIVSVSKRPERINDAAAAIFVITEDDIRRSGATCIPELFRMVPGMHVARIDANKWAVTARGFNGRFANKLLVLVDGRSAYEPVFSGVFWDIEGVPLPDIERVEVIRGPGATLWGANAVNGVINIITKQAVATQGALATVTLGTEERALGTLRYGSRLGSHAHYRVTADYAKRDASVDENGEPSDDAWDVLRVAGRVDWSLSERDEFSLNGRYVNTGLPTSYSKPLLVPPYSQDLESTFDQESVVVQAGWSRRIGTDAQLELLGYFIGSSVNDSLAIMEERTVDLELRHSFPLGDQHAIVWGAGFRAVHDELEPALAVFEPTSQQTNLVNVFLQDDWSVARDRLRLVLGAKVEYKERADAEVQPNARFVWTPHHSHTVWGAVSRAVRTPSRYEESVSFDVLTLPPGSPVNPGPLPVLMRTSGDADLQAEDLTAYELGYRVTPQTNLFVDLALFYNEYDHLRSMVVGEPVPVMDPIPHIVTLARFAGNIEGETWGAELAADWQATSAWRLHAAYTLLDSDLRLLAGDAAANQNFSTIVSAKHLFSLRSGINFGHNLESDLWLKCSAEIAELAVEGRWALDARLAWRPAPRLELSVVGQNLLAPQALEFRETWLDGMPGQVQRGVYGKVLVWF